MSGVARRGWRRLPERWFPVGMPSKMGRGGGPGDEPSWARQLHTLYFDSDAHRRRRRRQCAAGLIVATALAAGAVFAVVERGRSSSARSVRASGADRRPPGPTSVVTRGVVRPPSYEPGGGRTLLPNNRVVAFYGAAGNPRLGVLGEAPPEQLWPRLDAQAAAYRQSGTPVVPAYELITYTTQAAPGPANTYSAEITDATIERYLEVVRAHHGLLILDIQPGRAEFLADAQTLEHWLAEPDVALALDPEWKLDAGQLPSKQIGHTTAAAVNAVSAWLSQLVATENLPQKLLLIHQFTPDMVRDKPSVQSPPGVAVVFNMDGYGGQAVKLSKYQLLAEDTRFPLGFKVFYHQDVSPFGPSDLLGFTPTPSVIEYQ
jgi:hypothetical protein